MDNWRIKKCKLSVTEISFYTDDYQPAKRVSLRIYQITSLLVPQAYLSEIFQAYLQPYQTVICQEDYAMSGIPLA